jgi:hypothetical protein
MPFFNDDASVIMGALKTNRHLFTLALIAHQH